MKNNFGHPPGSLVKIKNTDNIEYVIHTTKNGWHTLTNNLKKFRTPDLIIQHQIIITPRRTSRSSRRTSRTSRRTSKITMNQIEFIKDFEDNFCVEKKDTQKIKTFFDNWDIFIRYNFPLDKNDFLTYPLLAKISLSYNLYLKLKEQPKELGWPLNLIECS